MQTYECNLICTYLLDTSSILSVCVCAERLGFGVFLKAWKVNIAYLLLLGIIFMNIFSK